MGRIFAVKHFEIHDGPGIRTTVFLKGCPLRCLWCHNPEGLRGEKQLAFFAEKCSSCGHCAGLCAAHTIRGGEHVFDRARCAACGRCAKECPAGALALYGWDAEPRELLPELEADRLYYEQTGGGVTLSGGEPMAQADFVLALLRLLKERGISCALDTSGFAPWKAYADAAPYLDRVLWDVKAADDALHRKLTGQSNAPILENLKRMDETGVDIDIRIPLIPGLNDGEIGAIGRLLLPLRHVREVKVLPYHAYSGSLYRALGMPYPLEGHPVPEEEAEKRAVDTLAKTGLPAVGHRGAS